MARRAELIGAVNIGWKWLAGILTSIVILGSAAWMNTVASDSRELRVQIAQLQREMGEKANDINSIKKDVEIIKKSQDKAEASQAEARKETREGLDRLKELLQDEHFGKRQRAN